MESMVDSGQLERNLSASELAISPPLLPPMDQAFGSNERVGNITSDVISHEELDGILHNLKIGENEKSIVNDVVIPIADKIPNLFLIKETLLSKHKFRSDIGIAAVRDLFRYHSSIIGEVKQCSDYDLNMVISNCELCSIKSNSKESLGSQGKTIDLCYIVLSFSRRSNFKNYNDQKQCYVPQGRLHIEEGAFIGLEFFDGMEIWPHSTSVITRDNEEVVLCQIPTNSIARFIGRSSNAAKAYCETFWRSTRLISEVHDSDAFSFISKNVDISVITGGAKQEIDLLNSSRMRRYVAGMDVFTQGSNRTYLYFIISGECALLRQYPSWIGPDVIPEEVDTGQRYLSGDFCFMDGEDVTWVDTIIEQQQQELRARSKDTSDELSISELIAMKSKKGPFQQHKNVLYALTQVELIVISLFEISKNRRLFRELIALSSLIYPGSLYSSSDIVYKYHENRLWNSVEKKAVLRQVFTEKFGNELAEYIHPDSCVNYNYSKSKEVGAKTKTNNTASNLSYLFQQEAHSSLPRRTELSSTSPLKCHRTIQNTITATASSKSPTAPPSPQPSSSSFQSHHCSKKGTNAIQLQTFTDTTSFNDSEEKSPKSEFVPETPDDFVQLYEARLAKRSMQMLWKSKISAVVKQKNFIGAMRRQSIRRTISKIS